MARDFQRSRVYAAEQAVRAQLDFAGQGATEVRIAGMRLTLEPELLFGELGAVSRYIAALQAASWFQRDFPHADAPVAVRERAGASRAHYERRGCTIAVPVAARGRSWALREIVVLHEMAHHVSVDADLAAHGPRFCGDFVHLVEQWMSPETAFLLRHSMHEAAVKLAPFVPAGPALCGVENARPARPGTVGAHHAPGGLG